MNEVSDGQGVPCHINDTEAGISYSCCQLKGTYSTWLFPAEKELLR